MPNFELTLYEYVRNIENKLRSMPLYLGGVSGPSGGVGGPSGGFIGALPQGRIAFDETESNTVSPSGGSLVDNLNNIRSRIYALEEAPPEGHVIQLEGTPFTQRTNLNLLGGFKVDDDSVNDATLVRVPHWGKSVKISSSSDVSYYDTPQGALADSSDGEVVVIPPGVHVGDLELPYGVGVIGWDRENTEITGKIILGGNNYVADLRTTFSEENSDPIYCVTDAETGACYFYNCYLRVQNTGTGNAYGIQSTWANSEIYLFNCQLYSYASAGSAYGFYHNAGTGTLRIYGGFVYGQTAPIEEYDPSSDPKVFTNGVAFSGATIYGKIGKSLVGDKSAYNALDLPERHTTEVGQDKYTLHNPPTTTAGEVPFSNGTSYEAVNLDERYVQIASLPDHNDLSGIQGGTTDEYYHLTSAKKTVVDNTSGTNTGDVTLSTANGLTLTGQALSMTAADSTNRGTVILTPSTGSADVTAGKAVQASDAPATPAANRVVRLDGNGDLLLPSGGDVLPEGETSTARGLGATTVKIGGTRDIIGDYGFNPAQTIVPASWALGQADRCLDDFFRTNTGSPNLSIWSAVTDCDANTSGTSLQFFASQSSRSWLITQAKNTLSTAPKNHAIYQATYTETFTSGQFFIAKFINGFQGATKRSGFIIMNSDLLNGAAFWLENNSSNYANLYCATYNHATEAWLSHTNAKSSNVAYTTNWTTRYTSQNIYPEWMRPQMVAFRPISGTDMTTGNLMQFWIYDSSGITRNRLAYVSLPYRITPYYIYMFTEGNVDSLSLTSYWDFIGRGALA